MNNKIKTKINSYLTMHEKYRHAYFWTSFGNAASRRNQEKKFADSYPIFFFRNNGKLIEVKPYFSLSCRNVYYKLEIRVNGEKKDIRALKKII